MSEEPQRRRRWRPLITTLVVAVSGVWISHSMQRIRDRHQFLDNRQGIVPVQIGKTESPTAPSGLWLFGEAGVARLMVTNAEDAKLARILFPEAEVLNGGLDR